jgi:branched-chain amino acid transport system substrate-binding protein
VRWPRPARLPAALVAACALALPGCLGDEREERSARVSGDTLTIYASLPRSGVSAPVADAVAAGQRRALADAGGRVGRWKVRLRQLDATEPGDVLWNPDRVSANAERAADDPTTIAYLGELEYGGSAVSLPITNDDEILQVAPLDALTSLTTTPPGRPRSSPERLYPSERRTFLRLVPTDELQVETLLARARERGSRRLGVVFDEGVYGRELAAQLVALARRDGPEPVRSEEYQGEIEEIPDMVRKLAEADVDAVAYAGIAGPGSGRILAEVDRALPGVPVYAAAGLLARDPRVPFPAAPFTVEALSPVLPASELPRRSRRLLREIEAEAGRPLARPEAMYGYESVRLVLDAVEEAGADRRGVARAALAIRERDSVLGRYGIRATGDVDLERFARHRLEDGRFRFIELAD